MEKISLVGGLLLFGLFVAALSSVLGGLVGPPRVLQRIAEDNVLPILKPFAQLAGSNKEPRNATLLCASITLMFIFVGNLNKLAPIVTMPFLSTYMAINYAYFAMAMSYDCQLKQTAKVEGKLKNNNSGGTTTASTTTGSPKNAFSYGALKNERSFENVVETELNSVVGDSNIFSTTVGVAKKTVSDGNGNVKVDADTPLVMEDDSLREKEDVVTDEELNVESNIVSPDHVSLSNKDQQIGEGGQFYDFIHKRNTKTLYGRVCNRWVSLFASLVCFILSFCISWVYALANLCITLMLYICISQARPGLAPGVASDFQFSTWLISLIPNKKKDEEEEQIIIQSAQLPYGISTHVITQDNMDYEHRDKKHLASVINKPVPYG